MTPALLALIEGIISEAPTAIALWGQIKTIVTEGREPTPEEWAALDAARDAHHAAVQAA